MTKKGKFESPTITPSSSASPSPASPSPSGSQEGHSFSPPTQTATFTHSSVSSVTSPPKNKFQTPNRNPSTSTSSSSSSTPIPSRRSSNSSFSPPVSFPSSSRSPASSVRSIPSAARPPMAPSPEQCKQPLPNEHVSKPERSEDEEEFDWKTFNAVQISFLVFLLGVLLGGLTVLFLAPHTARFDLNFPEQSVARKVALSCLSNTASSSSSPASSAPPPSCPACPVAPEPPPCPRCASTGFLVEKNELMGRGNTELNPYNAPSVEGFENPRMLPIQSFLTPEESQWLIQTVLEKENFEEGRVSNPQGVTNREQNRRVSLAVLANDKTYGWLYERIMQIVSQYNQKYWKYKIPTNALSILFEPIQFYRYESTNLGHYNWHADIGLGGATGKRCLSLSIQLSKSEDYEGGEFSIMTSSDPPSNMTRTQGSMLLFPSYLLHRITPVTKGTRYSIVAWIEQA